jgi:CDP-glycerol glycerophosphotransferase (TagB/SpsB family)
MAEFTNLLFHCDLLVNYASTLALDVACFDKPIICLNYGIRIIKGRDLTNVAYQTCHYKWVLETGAVSLAANQEELYHQINYYLEYPETKRKERRQLVENLCYKLDGYSADRLTREVLISLDLIQ